MQAARLGGRVPDSGTCGPTPTTRPTPSAPGQYGAEGIGLCRTEHMFFEQRAAADRAEDDHDRVTPQSGARRSTRCSRCSGRTSPVCSGQWTDFPVIIRLIDPPLHEFLPGRSEGSAASWRTTRSAYPRRERSTEIEELLAQVEDEEHMLARVEALREANPMLGTRGVRLGIMMPELTRMQVRAIFEAACAVTREGIDVHPEVMIPLTSHVNELIRQRAVLEAEAKAVMEEEGVSVAYMFGTMIEIPRAALTADEIAEYAEFFSFGTNDLTQTTFGISRDDAESGFLLTYLQEGILDDNPFATLDRDGVGKLMSQAVAAGRAVRPDLEVGICGEHGGDPRSIALCHEMGLDYVSCSPYRVPIARLAAAQAAVNSKA